MQPLISRAGNRHFRNKQSRIKGARPVTDNLSEIILATRFSRIFNIINYTIMKLDMRKFTVF